MKHFGATHFLYHSITCIRYSRKNEGILLHGMKTLQIEREVYQHHFSHTVYAGACSLSEVWVRHSVYYVYVDICDSIFVWHIMFYSKTWISLRGDNSWLFHFLRHQICHRHPRDFKNSDGLCKLQCVLGFNISHCKYQFLPCSSTSAASALRNTTTTRLVVRLWGMKYQTGRSDGILLSWLDIFNAKTNKTNITETKLQKSMLVQGTGDEEHEPHPRNESEIMCSHATLLWSNGECPRVVQKTVVFGALGVLLLSFGSWAFSP